MVWAIEFTNCSDNTVDVISRNLENGISVLRRKAMLVFEIG